MVAVFTYTGVTPSLCRGFLDVFTGMGMDIRMEGEAMLVQMYHRPVNLHKICTGAYPDFPTDMQSMVLSVASVGEGTLILKNRFLKTVLRLCHGSKKWVRILHCPGTACL